MRHRLSITLFTLAATITLAASTTAVANRLSISSTTFRVVWSRLEFREASGAGISCPVTLEGSLHSATISKIVGSLIGAITRAIAGEASCTEPLHLFAAHAWIYNGTEVSLGTRLRSSLPWHVTYEGFEGSLPSEITGVRLLLVGLKFATQIAASACLATYGGPTERVIGIAVLGTGGVIRSIRPEANARLREQEPRSASCPEPGLFTGESTVTQLGNTSAITVTLLEGGSLSPSPVAFGTIEPSQLAVRTVTFTAGTEGATVRSIRVAEANYFAITDPNRCVGARLGERGTCSFKVVFVAPAEAGRAVEDTVTVETSIETVRDTVTGST